MHPSPVCEASGSVGKARCVAFDLDDTLYLERDYVRSGFRAVGEWARERLGVEGFSARAWRAFEQGARGSVFDETLVDSGVAPDPAVVRAMVEVYRAHEPAIELLPDAREAIGLVGRPCDLAVVSDGPAASQRAKARVLAAHDWAKVIVLTEEHGEGFAKPSPRAFEHVELSLGCVGADCVYVADNPGKDFVGPHARGWRTVRVRRPRSLHAALESDADVDVEVASLEALDAILAL